MVPDLGRELGKARNRTDELFTVVRSSDIYLRPIPERHRIIFYLGHLEAFDWNQVCRGALDMPPFEAAFDRLFAFGIDPPPGQLPADEPGDWPSLQEVEAYNRQVRQTVDSVLPRVPEQQVHVAIEHRLMHAETLAYMLHNLPLECKLPPLVPPPAPGSAPRAATIEIPGGTVTLGQQRGGGFGWDNEFDEHLVPVAGFEIDKYKVTNGDYLKFVEQGAEAPHFWVRVGDAWLLRRMFDRIPLPLDHPVYVTHEQAAAYARWMGKALPTEAQYHRAAFGTPSGEEQSYPWGETTPHSRLGNFDFCHWDTVAVTANPESDSAFGASQMVGNGWEWTSTVFHPFPGFEPFPFYPGYSANFFDEAHFVMKGGSPRTAACMLRRSFRNWFRPDYPYVYASFRLVNA